MAIPIVHDNLRKFKHVIFRYDGDDAVISFNTPGTVLFLVNPRRQPEVAVDFGVHGRHIVHIWMIEVTTDEH